MPTDEELIRAFRKSQEAQILDELVRRHLGRVHSMILAIVLNHSDADELTQEVFLRAIRGLDQFNGESQFSTWLFRIAKNTTFRFLERSQRAPVLNNSVVDEHPAIDAGQPDRRLLHSELESEIEAAIASLSPPLRTAMALVMIQGCDVTEAAEIANCTVSTMYWRIHEARKILGGMLERYLS